MKKRPRLHEMRKIRCDMNLKQSDIAKAVGISVAYVSMIETGARSLDYEIAIKIAQYLNTTPDALFLQSYVQYMENVA